LKIIQPIAPSISAITRSVGEIMSFSSSFQPRRCASLGSAFAVCSQARVGQIVVDPSGALPTLRSLRSCDGCVPAH
jgi:hypothetical protein